MAPIETENNAYGKFWGDKQRTLWYVMVFSGVVNFSALLFLALGSESHTFFLLGVGKSVQDH